MKEEAVCKSQKSKAKDKNKPVNAVTMEWWFYEVTQSVVGRIGRESFVSCRKWMSSVFREREKK